MVSGVSFGEMQVNTILKCMIKVEWSQGQKHTVFTWRLFFYREVKMSHNIYLKLNTNEITELVVDYNAPNIDVDAKTPQMFKM